MRIIFKKEQDRIDELLETQHNELNLFKGKVRKLEKKLEFADSREAEHKKKIADLEEKLSVANGAKGGYTKKINELTNEVKENKKELDTKTALVRHLEKQLEDQRSYYSSQLEEANKKIENYKKDALSNRIKPTAKEYEQRLKYRSNKKAA